MPDQPNSHFRSLRQYAGTKNHLIPTIKELGIPRDASCDLQRYFQQRHLERRRRFLASATAFQKTQEEDDRKRQELLDAAEAKAAAEKEAAEKADRNRQRRRELRRQLLDEVLEPVDDQITQILIAIAERFPPVSCIDLMSKRRTTDIVRARFIAIYLARTITAKSFSEIGRRIGRRDHSTVIRACGIIAEGIKNDPALQTDVDGLLEALGR